MSRLGVKVPRWENEGKVRRHGVGLLKKETRLKVNRRRLSQRLDDRLDSTQLNISDMLLSRNAQVGECYGELMCLREVVSSHAGDGADWMTRKQTRAVCGRRLRGNRCKRRARVGRWRR